MDDLSKTNDCLAKLTKHKGSEGHKLMVELAKQRMSFFMAEFMDGDDVDLQQSRADFRAWKGVVTLLEQAAFEYESYIARILHEQELQAQQSQGGMSHGRF